jgi:hypothetical protein
MPLRQTKPALASLTIISAGVAVAAQGVKLAFGYHNPGRSSPDRILRPTSRRDRHNSRHCCRWPRRNLGQGPRHQANHH